MNNNTLSLVPLGGVGDVTRNMYVYEYSDSSEAEKNQVLLVDCGLGFADETMLGVDLLLPDISYLLKNKKNIIGMLFTHGHEDHIGALPFVLPQLPGNFPLFATPLTAAFLNEKLKEFGVKRQVQTVHFEKPEVKIGPFTATFIRVTHSVPDTSHIFIQTPVGNFYHGSDFKFDDHPADGIVSDKEKIKMFSEKGVLCLLSDSLGAERMGRTGPENALEAHFTREIQNCPGKFIVTTYSSNLARLNQVVRVSEKANRKVCFIGRSLIKAKDIGKRLGYLQLPDALEIPIEDLKKYPDHALTLIVAGSQGQENSAMTRSVNGEHRDVKITEKDTIIFSADPIPGNEVPVYELIDAIAKKGSRVRYSDVTHDFHVSGHGASEELKELITLVRPKKLLPIGGAFRHMVAYKELAQSLGYKAYDVLLVEDGQEILFSQNDARLGKLFESKHVYVDEVSGEEMDSFVLRDRKRLSEGGIVIVLAEIDSATGQLLEDPDIIIRGVTTGEENKMLSVKLTHDLRKTLSGKKGRVNNWFYIRKLIGEVSERRIFKELRRRPLVLPVAIEI